MRLFFISAQSKTTVRGNITLWESLTKIETYSCENGLPEEAILTIAGIAASGRFGKWIFEFPHVHDHHTTVAW